MPPSATYRRWDVVAVPYPFVEGTEAKRRPALIVSTDTLHERHGVYWAAMITTASAGTRIDDIPIMDLQVAGLPAECVIRLSRLATLGDAQISRRLGTLTARDRRSVLGLLKLFAG